MAPSRRIFLKTVGSSIVGLGATKNLQQTEMEKNSDLGDLLTFEGRPIKTSRQWEMKREDIRRAFIDTIGEFPSEIPEFKPTIVEETNVGTYVRRKVTYQVHRDEQVPAFLLIPKHLKVTTPAILCLPQTTPEGIREPAGISGNSSLFYAHDLAERGFVCLTPEHLASGERSTKGLEQFDTSEFYRKFPNWSAVGKAIWDGQRALDYLESLEFVDRQRIGCIGHSLGGHGTIFLAGMDKRVKAAVSSCGVELFANNPRRLEWARDCWYIYFPRLRPIFLGNQKPPFDFHELCALIAPRAFMNITAFNDEIYNTENMDMVAELGVRVDKVYRLLGTEEKFANYMHGSRHGFPVEARELAYSWLRRWLV
jgi:hypothetical protein